MAASLGNAVGAVGGYMKYKEGKKMQKEAQKKIDNFKWRDLNNPFRTTQVSTLGSDLQREENARTNATVMQGLRGAGTRGILGGAGAVVEGSNDVNRRIAANLDEQQKNLDVMAAQDDVNIRNMWENRQSNELAGYGQMLNIGRADKYGGMADMMNAGQAQGQTNMAIMNSVMGGMSGGGGGGGGMGGMMGGGGGGGGGNMSPVTGKYNEQNAYIAQYYGGRNV